MAQPNYETFKTKVRTTKKDERKANIGVAIVMAAATVFAILQYVA